MLDFLATNDQDETFIGLASTINVYGVTDFHQQIAASISLGENFPWIFIHHQNIQRYGIDLAQVRRLRYSSKFQFDTSATSMIIEKDDQTCFARMQSVESRESNKISCD